MASVDPADQLEGRRTAGGISVDSDKMMTSCIGWFKLKKKNLWIPLFPEILKRRSCQVENVPLPEAAGSVPPKAPAGLHSEPAARAATRRSLLRLCLSKPVIRGIYAAAGPSDSCESTDHPPLPPLSAESALVLRPGSTSLNCFDEMIF